MLSQLLALRGGYGYVSNFVARFYKAPAVGMMLQEILGESLGPKNVNLQSSFGQTFGLLQPHEFGYFWDRWFDLGQDSHKLSDEDLARVPQAMLAREIANMESVSGMPMVFKHLPYFSMQVPWLLKVFPNSVFVSCMRDPLYNAQSIALARESLLGSRDKWLSTRPQEIGGLLGLPWHEQIGRQIQSIRAEIEEARRRVPPEQWVDCDYEQLCGTPGGIVARVDAAVTALGASLPEPAETPASVACRKTQVLASDDFELLRIVCASADPWRADAMRSEPTGAGGCF